MMAFEGAANAPALVNGANTPSPAEDAELYDQLVRLRDDVIAGKHASLKLPASAIDQLKASLIAPDVQQHLNGGINGSAFATNQSQPQQSSFLISPNAWATKPASSALDPIFLEKSDNLVRAEGQLKRQRLDRDLQTQVDQRKYTSREKDTDGPSAIDTDATLASAWERVKPISGLKVVGKAGSAASSSFDENDYYSSQVQSEWSSEASSSNGSDVATGAFTNDFERLDDSTQASNSHAKRPVRGREPVIHEPASKSQQNTYVDEDDDMYDPEEEDDDYTPPDATAFDSYRQESTMGTQRIPRFSPPDDDNSEYEPGDITQESTIPTPTQYTGQTAQQSPNVPVIRNHLTHIVAPQPNRVSPLATAKGSNIELELVDGRPEVVQKPKERSNIAQSRASTASPPGNGVGGSGKKKRNKKRKRDQEPTGRAKRRHKQTAIESPASPVDQEPYIKPEPVSPPPFANVPEAPPYGQPHPQPRPTQVNMVSPRHAPQVQYVPDPPRSGLRYEHVRSAEPSVVRVASASHHRPVQRDTQDLRRVASLQYAQRPASPQQRVYTPVAPYKPAPPAYGGEPRYSQSLPSEESHASPRYRERETTQYHRAERSQSPPRFREYRDPYAERVASPSLMPPPPQAQPRQIYTDQYGQRYYAAEPTQAPPYASRASAAPPQMRPQPDVGYEPQSSHMSAQYEPPDVRMPPPPLSRRQAGPEQRMEYDDPNDYRVREYHPRPSEQTRYAPESTSPVYQQARGYEQMPPPAPPGERTSPLYVTRSYSVRPEEFRSVQSYLRHASVAPVQYVRQDAPPPPQRAVSVMPGTDYNNSGMPPPQQRPYSQAPQGVRYVDQYGNEVFPRQVSEMRYQ